MPKPSVKDFDLNEGVIYTAGGIGVRTLDNANEFDANNGDQTSGKYPRFKKQKRATSSIASVGMNNGVPLQENTQPNQQVTIHGMSPYQKIINQQAVSNNNLKYEPLIS